MRPRQRAAITGRTKRSLSRGFALVGEYAFPVGRTRDRELIVRRA